MTWPFRTCFRMPSPSNTARACLALGRHRKTISPLLTISATEPAALAPSVRSRANGSGARSNTITAAPLFLTRLRQSGSPMTPSPMKPMVLVSGIVRLAHLLHERARRVEMQRKGIDLGVGAWIDLGHDRIMAWDETIGMTGQPLDRFPPRCHVADIVDDRKRAAAVQIGKEMRRIGCQHYRPARGIDAHHLQAVGMSADPMHGHARSHFAVAGIEGDALAIDVTPHLRHVLDRKRMPQQPVAHAAAGRIGHFALLQVKARIGKAVEIAGMVVMQMRDDDILDSVGPNAEPLQRIDRVERQLAPANFRFLGVEAGIHQDVSTAAADQPDKIVEVLGRALMWVRRQIIHVWGTSRHGGVAERVNFVSVSHRFHFWLVAANPRTKPSTSRKVKWAGCMSAP